MYRKGGSMGSMGSGRRSIRANPGRQQIGSQEQQEPPPVPRASQQTFSQLDRLLLDLHFQRMRLGDSPNFQQFIRTQRPELYQRIQMLARSSGLNAQHIISSSSELPQHLRNYRPQGSGHRSQDDLYASQSSIGTTPPSSPPLIIQPQPPSQSPKSVPNGYDLASAYYSSQQSKQTGSSRVSRQQGIDYQGGSSSTIRSTGTSTESSTESSTGHQQISTPRRQTRQTRHQQGGSHQMMKRGQTSKPPDQTRKPQDRQGGGGGSNSGYQGGASSDQQQDQSGRMKRRKR